MPLYEVGGSGLERQPVAAFKALGLYERADLQRLLREEISPLGDDCSSLPRNTVTGKTLVDV